ncbi:MAG: hypothetical protein IT427_17240 [Pirellulales bacterium]|nr:hypothetical protein [Pirellulales bacterium]
MAEWIGGTPAFRTENSTGWPGANDPLEPPIKKHLQSNSYTFKIHAGADGLQTSKEAIMKHVISTLSAFAATLVLSQLTLAQQPFSNVQQQATVSPYLNLVNRTGSAMPNYQTLVRPQLQSDQQFAKQQNQIQRLQRQTAGLAAGGGYGPRGISSQIRGTGHVTRFMDTSHFFPQRQ